MILPGIDDVKLPGTHSIQITCHSLNCSTCQEWEDTAKEYVEGRALSCKEHIKVQIGSMFANYLGRTGRWDLEGLKVKVSESAGKASATRVAD